MPPRGNNNCVIGMPAPDDVYDDGGNRCRRRRQMMFVSSSSSSSDWTTSTGHRWIGRWRRCEDGT